MKRSLFNPRNFTKSKTSAKWFPLLLFLTVLVLPSLSMGQAGSLDPLFGINGIVTTANTGANAAALQSDGKIVVAGGIAIQQNFQQPGLLRYNTNGTLDPSFGTGGEVLIGGTNAGPACAVAIQTDGKILTAAPGNLRLKVFRFNTNGSPDTTFGSNGAATIQAAGLFLPPASEGLALQSNGRILVATGRIVARLLTNGQLDSTFGLNGAAATVGGESIVLLPNGNILIGAGSVASLYAPNGSLVTSFGVNGQTPGFAFNGAGGFVVSTNSTGVTRIISAGSIVTSPNLMFTHSVSGFLLVSYNTDGTIDNSFGNHGGVATPFPGNILAHAFALALQRNGDIVAVGQTALTDVDAVPGPSDFALVRYSPNGRVDTTFGNGGFVSTPFGTSEAFANTVLIQIDGKIVAVGNSNSGTTLARYLAN
ncbi:MAG: hypothetical protein AUG81_08000 [Verrucomicrobia bacterium 13_1_20CM_4_54_11]|nr:MAG: hypothetical protein AUG81_08000 [Verrucomicrobia bacterium 13_1_20CM_4_54_11]